MTFDRAASAVAFAAVESIESGALDNFLGQIKYAAEKRMKTVEYKATILDRVSFRAGELSAGSAGGAAGEPT